MGRALVAEAARAEVVADPHIAVLVLEQVDIVVAGADGAELRPRHLLEVTDAGIARHSGLSKRACSIGFGVACGRARS